MTETTLWLLAILGAAIPLLPLWRWLIVSAVIFTIVNATLIAVALHDIESQPNPGPGARGLLVLFVMPVALFVSVACIRLIVTVLRHKHKNRRAKPATPPTD